LTRLLLTLQSLIRRGSKKPRLGFHLERSGAWGRCPFGGRRTPIGAGQLSDSLDGGLGKPGEARSIRR
jgi:hypothetical protein